MVRLKENIQTVNVYASPVAIRLVQATEFHYEPGEVVPSHRHQIAEIRFVIKGKIRAYVGKKRYLSSNNSFYFIRAGDTHYQYTVTKTKMYHLAFFITNIKAKGILRYNKNYIKKKDVNKIKRIIEYPSVVFNTPNELVDLLNNIYSNLQGENRDYRKLSKYFGSFLVKLSEILDSHIRYKKINGINLNKFDYKIRHVLGRTIKYIKTNYNKRINLHWMTRQLNLSTRHFERLFKQFLGCTPTEYLMNIRIQKALKLLENPELKVENIVKLLGFNNNSRFYKYFKRYLGISPGDYKRYSIENKEIINDLFKQE